MNKFRGPRANHTISSSLCYYCVGLKMQLWVDVPRSHISKLTSRLLSMFISRRISKLNSKLRTLILDLLIGKIDNMSLSIGCPGHDRNRGSRKGLLVNRPLKTMQWGWGDCLQVNRKTLRLFHIHDHAYESASLPFYCTGLTL